MVSWEGPKRNRTENTFSFFKLKSVTIRLLLAFKGTGILKHISMFEIYGVIDFYVWLTMKDSWLPKDPREFVSTSAKILVTERRPTSW